MDTEKITEIELNEQERQLIHLIRATEDGQLVISIEENKPVQVEIRKSISLLG